MYLLYAPLSLIVVRQNSLISRIQGYLDNL